VDGAEVDKVGGTTLEHIDRDNTAHRKQGIGNQDWESGRLVGQTSDLESEIWIGRTWNWK